MERVIPLSRRKGDIVVLVYWEYPLWPPAFFVDIIHWYGRNFDPVLIARPVWWRMTIWIDSLFFGPFYVFAIYAWTKGKNWIRIPSVIWASVMMTNVTIILGEEFMGPHLTSLAPPRGSARRFRGSSPRAA